MSKVIDYCASTSLGAIFHALALSSFIVDALVACSLATTSGHAVTLDVGAEIMLFECDCSVGLSTFCKVLGVF